MTRLGATPLLSPEALAQKYPLSAQARLRIFETRERLRLRLAADGGAPLVVVGPCSIHCEQAALEYAERLARLRDEIEEQERSRGETQGVVILMRVYFEKPRTTVGWKGFLYDPDLDGSSDLAKGLERARALMVRICEMGVPIATELLDPLAAAYFSDCLSWVAVGARTSESQVHRQMASGLPCPVGFKNGTDGSVHIAAQAIKAAATPHAHLGVNDYGAVSVIRTGGNDSCHVVLRGGASGPNFCEFSVARAGAELVAHGLRPKVMVDCSHDNSAKDFRRQPDVARAVIEQLSRRDVDVLGLMLESHLHAGKQSAHGELRYGVSVTDGCIDFETTSQLLCEIAGARAAEPNRQGF